MAIKHRDTYTLEVSETGRESPSAPLTFKGVTGFNIDDRGMLILRVPGNSDMGIGGKTVYFAPGTWTHMVVLDELDLLPE